VITFAVARFLQRAIDGMDFASRLHHEIACMPDAREHKEDLFNFQKRREQ